MSRSPLLCRSLMLLIPLVLAAFAHPVVASADSYSWTGKGDQVSWSDKQNWDPQEVPGEDDEASVARLPGGPVSLSLGGAITIESLKQSEGSSITGGSLTLSKGLVWTGGQIFSDLTLEAGSKSTVSGRVDKLMGTGSPQHLINRGRLTIASDATVRVWDVAITNHGTLDLERGSELQGLRCCSPGFALIKNLGTLRVVAPQLPLPNRGSATISSIGVNTTGTIDVRTGVLDLISAPNEISAGATFSGRGRTRLSKGTGIVDAFATLDGAVKLTKRAAFELAAGGHLTGRGSFRGGTVRWTGGEISALLTTSRATKLLISGSKPKSIYRGKGRAGTLITAGTTHFDATGPLNFGGTAPALRNRGTFTVNSPAQLSGDVCCTTPAQFRNAGTLVLDTGAGKTATVAALALTNAGTLRLRSGELKVTNLPYVQTQGTTALNNTVLTAPEGVKLDGGTLRGSGSVAARLSNRARIAPGTRSGTGAYGVLKVLGAYTQRRSGTLELDLKKGVHDRLAIAGAAALAGTLKLNTASGYIPAPAGRTAILTTTARTRAFGVINNPSLPRARRWAADYGDTKVTLVATEDSGPSVCAPTSSTAGLAAFPPQSNKRITVEAGPDADHFGVELRNFRDPELYVPYTTDCTKAAFATLENIQGKLDHHRILYARKGGQPGLRTYNRLTKSRVSGAIDAQQSDLRWDADKVQETVGYIKARIDEGLPVYVGVNEGGGGQARQTCKEDDGPACDPKTQPFSNDGVTDHFLVIAGYRAARVGGAWQVTELLGVDNAPAQQKAPEAYPTFTVTPTSIRKPATRSNPSRAHHFEYQLTQVRIYQKDLARTRSDRAWTDE